MRLKLLVLWFGSLYPSIHAAAFIPQLSLVNETASSKNLFSPSSLSLSAPVIPDGFNAPIVFNRSQPLNAFNLWKSALEGMFEIVRKGGWEAPMESNIWVMAFTGSDVRFVVHALIPTIKLGYIAIALYNAVNAMFSLQPGFFESNTRFVLHGRQIGTMAIVKASLGDVAEYALNGNNTTNSTTVVPNTDLSFLNATVIKNGRNNEYHNSLILGSSAIDHEDHRLKVEFEYQTNVPRSDLWTAALDGMVTAMQFDGAARCDHISAVSISGNLVFHINELPNHMLTCGVAVKTFRLMALISMGYKEYKELEMSIFYDGTKVGEGYVLKIGRAGLVSGGQAATSES